MILLSLLSNSRAYSLFMPVLMCMSTDESASFTQLQFICQKTESTFVIIRHVNGVDNYVCHMFLNRPFSPYGDIVAYSLTVLWLPPYLIRTRAPSIPSHRPSIVFLDFAMFTPPLCSIMFVRIPFALTAFCISKSSSLPVYDL